MSGMPVDRNVEFYRYLELDTHLISIFPYCMDLIELRQLKLQL